MKCSICKHGETKPGKATVTLDRGGVTVVFRDVPGNICDNCGEEYLSAETTGRLLKILDDAIRSGVQVDVRQYSAA